MTHTSETPCRIASFSRQRRAMSAMLSIAATEHMVHALIEIDVTRSRRILHEQGLSFTAFIATCIGQAVGENPSVQSMRLGRKRLVIYDDVDISILVEHDAASGKLPTPYVARKSNRKSVQEIHDGIRTAQQQTAEQSFGPARWMPYLPRFALRFIFWLIGRQPRLMRQFGGTVALTAVGMFGTGLGWGMPISLATQMVTLGGIGQRLSYVDGKLVPRDVLCLTASFDHDLVDGAPAARFTGIDSKSSSRAATASTRPIARRFLAPITIAVSKVPAAVTRHAPSGARPRAVSSTRPCGPTCPRSRR